MSIKETAFYKYLLTLTHEHRVVHLFDCALNHGELFYELAEEFKELNPVKLSKMIEEQERKGK